MSEPTEPQVIEPNWEERLGRLASKHGRNLFFVLFGLVAIGFAFYQFFFHQSAKVHKDYQEATAYFQRFVGSDESLEPLQDLLLRYPGLAAKYDASIAQELLIRQEGERAEPFMERTLGRLGDFGKTLYNQYAQGSLLLAKGDFEQALVAAKALEEKLKMQGKGAAHGAVLRGCNLLRVAFLQGQLANKEGEAAAWKTWKAWELDHSDTARELAQSFRAGRLSLGDYIKKRGGSA